MVKKSGEESESVEESENWKYTDKKWIEHSERLPQYPKRYPDVHFYGMSALRYPFIWGNVFDYP